MTTYVLFFLASIVAGVINAVAGDGGLITFPLLMLVTGPMTADATSAVAGFASYPTAVWRTRKLLSGVWGSGWLWLLLIPSVLGGLIGALLLSACDRTLRRCYGQSQWRVFWSGYRYSDDRRFDLHFARRDSPCRCVKEFFKCWMRGVAVFVLVLDSNVDWKYGAPMAVGGLVGGYIGE